MATPGASHLGGFGGVAEWTKAAVLKTAVPQGTGGSNPSPSASFNPAQGRLFCGIIVFCLFDRGVIGAATTRRGIACHALKSDMESQRKERRRRMP